MTAATVVAASPVLAGIALAVCSAVSNNSGMVVEKYAIRRLPELHARRALEMDGLTLLRQSDAGDWVVEAASGQPVFRAPDEAPCTVEVGDGLVLAMAGPGLESSATTLQRSFVDRLLHVREREQLTQSLGHVRPDRTG